MTDQKDSRDDELFDCNDLDLHASISSYYGNRRTVVAAFIKDKCRSSSIKYFTILDMYELIELKLGYPIPVKRFKSSNPKLNQ